MEQFANNASSTLNGSINNVTTTIVVNSGTSFPSVGNFRLLIGTTPSTAEIVLVTSRSGNTLTVIRGQENTTAQSWADLTTVTHILTKGAVETLRDTLKGKTLSSTLETIGATQDGYSLVWQNTDGYWAAKPITTTSLQFALPHDTTYSPIALYQFNGNLNDSSGNSRTLTLDAGTARYADISPHLKGFAFDGSTRLKQTDTVFSITGDITVEMLITISTTGADRTIFSYMSSGESLATNYLYGMYQINTGLFFESFWEFAAGTNVTYDNTTASYQVGEIFHLAYVRQSNQVTFYVNGKIFGATSGTLTAPATTAGTQNFYVGGNLTDTSFVGIISSLKVFNSALTATQIESEFELTLGNIYNKAILNSTTTSLSGNTVLQQSLSSLQDGYVLTWNNPSWSALPPSGGSNAIAWSSTKTTNFTATFSDKYIPVNTTGGAVTITLPASPVDGEFHLITDVTGTAPTNNITINGGGHNIIGFSTYIMTGAYNTLQVAYHVGQGIWVII